MFVKPIRNLLAFIIVNTNETTIMYYEENHIDNYGTTAFK